MQKSLLIAKSLRKLRILQRGWLIAFNFNLNKKFRGTTFKIPILKNIGWSIIFEKESWMTEILEILVPSIQGIFVDVGVNIGQTLLKLKSIDQTRDYFGFEVNPSCITYLKELVKVNGFQNINLFPFGLSDKSGISKLQFYYNNEVDVTASIISDYRPNDQVVKSEYVILSRLDDIEVVAPNNIGILKVDVEGAELEVLSGAKKTLSNNRPVIIIEILPVYSEANLNHINRQNQVESLLIEMNYSFFRIIKNNKNHFAGLTRLDSFQIESNISQSDYILIPDEKADKISNLLTN